MIMKLIVPLLIIVMFKCNPLTSAPTEGQAESSSASNKNDSDDQSGYVINNDDGLLQLHRSIRSDNNEIEARRRSAVDKGFMRFGRASNMLRFGRSMPSEYDNEENKVNDDEKQINEPFSMKMRRGNMMRFGRNHPLELENLENNEDYNDASESYDTPIDIPVRRSPENKYSEQGSKILRLGRSSESVESSEKNSREKKPTDGNILRFGRASNMLRFGRAGNMMRFGRGDNMMRFGRANNMLRFGRAGNVMRFGKRMNDIDYLRQSRAGNVMRFGRSDRNPMRFGKRSDDHHSSSSSSFCGDYDCLLQERENQQTDIENEDQLSSLFGDDDNADDIATQALQHKEYIITK